MSTNTPEKDAAFLRTAADERFQTELDRTGARDPRDFYRERLRGLRERNPEGYRAAVRYYENELIPKVATADSDPLGEWLEYGRLLANLWTDGSPVMIDPNGRSRPYSRPVPADHLVLHLPTSAREPALAVGLPAALSAAQHATYQLLVSRQGV